MIDGIKIIGAVFVIIYVVAVIKTMKEAITKLTSDHIKVKGGEYVRDYEHGEWERVSADKYVQHAYHFYRCSKCGYDHIGKTNFCPNCGADMRGEKDETD